MTVSVDILKMNYITGAVHTFVDIANITGCNGMVSKILGYDVGMALRQEVEGDLVGGLMGLVVIGVVLMICGIVLGNLEGPLDSAIPANSSFAELKTSIPSNLSNAMGIATIIPIIFAAMLILGVVYMLLGHGGQ